VFHYMHCISVITHRSWGQKVKVTHLPHWCCYCGHAGRNDCVGFLVISVVTESSVCLSELFLANFTTRSLPPFHRSSIAAPTWRCLGYDAADQFCVVDVTADTFSSVVLDPSKVTAVQLCQFYSQCQSRICVPYNL